MDTHTHRDINMCAHTFVTQTAIHTNSLFHPLTTDTHSNWIISAPADLSLSIYSSLYVLWHIPRSYCTSVLVFSVVAEWGSSYHRLLSSEASVNTSCMCWVEVEPDSTKHLCLFLWHVSALLFESVADFYGRSCSLVVVRWSCSVFHQNTIPHLNTISLSQPKEVTIVHCLLLSRSFLGLVCLFMCSQERDRGRQTTNHTTILCPGL